VAYSLAERYATALEGYLERGDEESLSGAYELGRRALYQGAGVLEIATVHRKALEAALARGGRDPLALVRSSEEFFAEVLGPFEMAHRGFREAAATFRELNERLENEIRRIAHSLHDEVQQLLAAVSILLEQMVQDLPEPASTRLAGILEHVDSVAGQVRRLSHELRPTILDDLGLVAALEFLAEGVARRGKIEIAVAGSVAGRLKPTTEIALYRIAQEALANVVRHAGARLVRVSVRSAPEALTLRIRDDGGGFDVRAALARTGRRGLGLVGIKERVEALGGTLHIDSAPGRGTEMVVEVPLTAAREVQDVDPAPARRRSQPRSAVAPGSARARRVPGPRRRR
jgi:signal transduction histidine kinase